MKQVYITPSVAWISLDEDDILTLSGYPNEVESYDGYIETPRY